MIQFWGYVQCRSPPIYLHYNKMLICFMNVKFAVNQCLKTQLLHIGNIHQIWLYYATLLLSEISCGQCWYLYPRQMENTPMSYAMLKHSWRPFSSYQKKACQGNCLANPSFGLALISNILVILEHNRLQFYSQCLSKEGLPCIAFFWYDKNKYAHL